MRPKGTSTPFSFPTLATLLLFLLVPLQTSTMALSLSHPHKLFVYGTLKRGLYNHDVYLKLAEQSGAALYLGVATTCDKLALKIVGPRNIPALMEDENAPYNVEGEVYQVTDSTLQAMDILEGIAVGFYDRVEKKVQLPQQQLNCVFLKPTGNCWIYLQKPQEGQSELPCYPSYTKELHQSYVPSRKGPDPAILALLQPKKEEPK